MKDRVSLFVGLGASTLAGVIVAVLVLALVFPTNLRSAQGAGHHHGGSAPLCVGAPDTSQSSFYSDMAKVNARMHQAMEIMPSGNVDRDFMQMMIPHHQGAVDMALVLLKYGREERLRRLAQSIIVEQGQEIAYMRALLDKPLVETPTLHHGSDQ